MIVYDISYCQPAGTVMSLSLTGADGVIIRNGYMAKTDTMFGTHMDDAIKLFGDKMIGSYTYVMAQTDQDAEVEAMNTIRRLTPYKAMISMPVYLDMESKKYCTTARRSANTALLMIELELLRKAGFGIGIYTNESFIRSFIDLPTIQRQFPRISLWLADYRKQPYDPAMPVDLWQYGTTKVNKIDVDTNECYVDFKSRNKFFK